MVYSIEQLNEKRPKPTNLTAISYVGRTERSSTGHRENIIECKCVCGGTIRMTTYYFTQGRYYSCGCLSRWGNEYFRNVKIDGKVVVNPLYSRYWNIKKRCYDPKHIGYATYGGRGVRMCDEWYHSFDKFVEWSLANGYSPEKVIDKDIKGGGLLYSPDTCLWVTIEENADCTSKSRYYDYEGQQLTLSKISKIVGIPRSTLYSRMEYGRTLDEAIAKGLPKRTSII